MSEPAASAAVASPRDYFEEQRGQAGHFIRVAALLGAVAFALMYVVDPLVIPKTRLRDLHAAWILRGVAIGALALLAVTSLKDRWSRRFGRPATLLSCLITGGTVIGLTWLTGGAESDYHFALYITFFGYALLPAPWRPLDAPLAFGALLLAYGGGMVIGQRHEPLGSFVTHVALLTVTAIVAAVLRWVLVGGRLAAWRQRMALAAANARLHALDEAKSRFFANLSHELRTPLTLTLAPLDTLLTAHRDPLTASQREALELAQRNALRLLRLVDDLLALTKAEAASLRLEPARVDLAASLQRFAEDVSGLTARKEIAFEVELADDLGAVEADVYLLERVLLNLVGNAARFTPEGGRITVGAAPAGRDEICLTVTDTGTGIAAQDLPRIFERFYQADTGATRRAGGTGIGLALVREIVELHHGRIVAESVVGEGTCMRIWLPRRQPARQPAPGDHSVSPAEAITQGLPEWHDAIRSARSYRLQGIDDATERRIAPRPRSKGHAPAVLVVEDNPDMIRFLVALLAADFNVLTAQNGLEGLRLATERRPDLIISDVMMPELSGVEMLERLRAQPETRSIPLIFLTARGSAEDRLIGRATGAETYLAKPFRSDELLAAVDALLDHQDTTQRAARSRHDESLVFMATGISERIEQALAGSELGARSLTAEPDCQALLRELSSQLRAFSTAGLEPVDPPAAVVATVRAVLAERAAREAAPAVHFTGEVEARVGLLESELAAVLAAVIDRAIMVTPAQGDIFVTARVGPDAVTVTVRDQGPPVTADDQERVFYAFYGPGSPGLGLAYYRHVLQARGGALEIDRQGVQPTFVLRLPLAESVPGCAA